MQAVYAPTKIIHDSPKDHPNAYVLVQEKGRHRLAVVEFGETQGYYYPKSWRYTNQGDIQRIENRAGREGGHVLILQSEAPSAAGLSDFRSSQSDYTTPAEEDKPRFATRDMDLGMGAEDHDAFDKYVHSINTTKLDMSHVDSPEAALRAILTGS